MDNERLIAAAKKQLDLVLSFFPRVDAKLSVVLAVDTGMLAFLAAKLPPIASLHRWDAVPALVSVILLGVSLWHLYKGAFPSLEGGAASLIYFREIAKRTESKYIDEFIQQNDRDYAKDMLGQVWRNSEILKKKFDHLKFAFNLLALAILPWLIALALFTMKSAATANISSPQ